MQRRLLWYRQPAHQSKPTPAISLHGLTEGSNALVQENPLDPAGDIMLLHELQLLVEQCPPRCGIVQFSFQDLILLSSMRQLHVQHQGQNHLVQAWRHSLLPVKLAC